MTYQGYPGRKNSNEDIYNHILHSHLTYLNQEETPAKLKQRRILEKLILEFLSLVPHNEKFCFVEIQNILGQSISQNQDFSAYKAALAFEALEKYATNLLSHPWRKEYRVVKMYNGFYRHSVESQLLGGSAVFLLLGYKQNEAGMLYMDEPIDPDRVTKVALDCLKACTECQMMLQICEDLKNYKCRWIEILNVREQYVCGVNEAVRILQQLKKTSVSSSNKCQQDGYLNGILENGKMESIPSRSRGDCMFNNPKFNVYPHPFCDNTVPSMNLHALQSSPHFALHSNKSVKKEPYQSNVEPITQPESMVLSYENDSPFSLSPYSDRGKMLDSHILSSDSLSPLFTKEPLLQKLPTFQNECGMHIPSSDLDKSHPLHAPSLPLDLQPALSPEPVLHTKSLTTYGSTNFPNYKFQQPIFSEQQSSGLTSRLHQLTLRDGTALNSQVLLNPSNSPYMERSSHMPRLDKNFLDLQADHSKYFDGSRHEKILKEQRQSFYDNVPTSFELTNQPPINPIDNVSKTKNYTMEPLMFANYSKKEAIDSSPVLMHFPDTSDSYAGVGTSREVSTSVASSVKSPKFTDALPSKVWPCSSCTFRNSKDKKICDMCGRSKFPGAECTPLLSGGQECPQCTLVNKKDVSNCTACGCSLKDSPTYI